MKTRIVTLLILGGLFLPFFYTVGNHQFAEPPWGFFGHRRINRLAVFTLPPEMIPFFKKHIEYITEHAVDPDKRRYATRHEAVRHYIDIDHWGEYPFENVPRDWTAALAKYTKLGTVSESGDTSWLFGPEYTVEVDGQLMFSGGVLKNSGIRVSSERYAQFVEETILSQYYDDAWKISCEQLEALFGEPLPAGICADAFAIDQFSEYGILPYYLPVMQRKLTHAFFGGDERAILRLAAELGHYIGDAHVPLHTTENYNGQLTGQDGIHAFWESRIPELFADDTYDYFVGPAEYIEDPKSYFWEVVLASHSQVDSVLGIEKDLSRTYPQDKQYCYEERLARTVRVPCTDYARAYQERMRGMVEERWRASILAIGSCWYTAWVDAGMPDLSKLEAPIASEEDTEWKLINEAYGKGDAKGRKHGTN